MAACVDVAVRGGSSCPPTRSNGLGVVKPNRSNGLGVVNVLARAVARSSISKLCRALFNRPSGGLLEAIVAARGAVSGVVVVKALNAS